MEIKSVTTIKLNSAERNKLYDAASILDDVYTNDIDERIQFDVTGLTLIDADDIATMLRKLIILSDAGNEIIGNLEL